MSWTRFMDMHSGGGLKESPYQYIYIELPPVQAVRYFYSRFGHNPYRITCTCCGEDYSVSPSSYEDQDASLQSLTAYDRRADVHEDGSETYSRWSARYRPDGRVIPLEEYLRQDDVLVISAQEIGSWSDPGYDPPEKGYVWR